MDNNIIVKATKIFTILFMAAAAILTALVIRYGDSLETNIDLAAKVLDPFFILSYVLLGLGVLIVFGFVFTIFATDPKGALRMLGSIGILGVIYLIAYFSASGSIDDKVFTDFDISSTQSKLIGSLIYLVYFLGGISILAIIFSGINKLIINR